MVFIILTGHTQKKIEQPKGTWHLSIHQNLLNGLYASKKMDVSFYQENLVTNDFFQKVRIIYRLKEAGYFHIPSMYKGFLVLKEEGALRKI